MNDKTLSQRPVMSPDLRSTTHPTCTFIFTVDIRYQAISLSDLVIRSAPITACGIWHISLMSHLCRPVAMPYRLKVKYTSSICLASLSVFLSKHYLSLVWCSADQSRSPVSSCSQDECSYRIASRGWLWSCRWCRYASVLDNSSVECSLIVVRLLLRLRHDGPLLPPESIHKVLDQAVRGVQHCITEHQTWSYRVWDRLCMDVGGNTVAELDGGLPVCPQDLAIVPPMLT